MWGFMQEELKKTIDEYRAKLVEMEEYLDLANKRSELERLETEAASSEFWHDRQQAQANISATRKVKQVLDPFDAIRNALDDAAIMLELAEAGEDVAPAEIEAEVRRAADGFSALEMQSLLGGDLDVGNAYLTLHAGAGGTESCDWADKLFRMFTRFAERQGFKVQVLDQQPGEEAGIKHLSLLIQGAYAYGMLKSERGVHRLVRISPFDSQSRRHTSFSAVDVNPELNDDIEIDMAESDLRIDTYRSQGAGGQHVNTTDSAVRIVHLPTGTAVQCQAERSQHKNRASALKMLKSRLYEIEQDKQRKAMDQLYSAKGEIAWGSQIRSYVMQPYTLVKDHRTNKQVGSVETVLDGWIEPFVQAYLKMNRS